MRSSRRELLAIAGGSLGVLGFSVYQHRQSNPTSVTGMDFTAINRRREPHTFYVSMEYDDGTGPWHSFELPPDEAAEKLIEPATDRLPRGLHGLVDEKSVFWEIEDGQGAICPTVDFWYERDRDPDIYVTVDRSCDRPGWPP